MVKELIGGLMVGCSKASTLMTKNKVLVFIYGPMVELIMVSGLKENSMALVTTLLSMNKEI